MKVLTSAVIGLLGLSLNLTALAADASTGPSDKVIHDYLISHPEVLIEMSQQLQKQQSDQAQELSQQVIKIIPTVASKLLSSDHPTMGPSHAPVRVIEFFDYQCGHCKEMAPIVKELAKSHSNIAVSFIEFPIFGNSSVIASKAALAAKLQNKYFEMSHQLMLTDNPMTEQKVYDAAKKVGINVHQLKKDMESKEISKQIDANLALAKTLMLPGTPGFIVMSNNETQASSPSATQFFIPGATSPDVLGQMIDQVASAKPAK